METASSLPMPEARAPLALHHFEPLRTAELEVLQAAARGDIAKISFQRPLRPEPHLCVRAEFLAFLARSGSTHVATRNLQIMGACIVGRFDLAEAQVPMSLWFYRCLFANSPRLEGSHIAGNLTFSDCSLPSLLGEGCRVEGDLSLNAGCSIDGDVKLQRARIGRDLDCVRMRLCGTAQEPSHFVADGIHVGGSAVLSGGFEAVGGVQFVAARIRGDFRATGARITADIDTDGARGVALDLDRSRMGGSLCLDGGFSVAGQVRLQRTRVESNLDCTGAAFDVVGDASWGVDSASLLLDGARVRGSLILRQLQGPLQGASLVDARVGALVDDASTWGQRHVLDGFSYTRLAGDAPTDAAMRVDWLGRQNATHLSHDFRPDPWHRLIKVLRRMGRGSSARHVAIERERRLRRAGLIGASAPPSMRWLVRAAHGIFGLLAGYGQRPIRLVWLALILWLLCSGAFWTAALDGTFVPSAELVLVDPRLNNCRPDCDVLPTTVPEFRPLMYSLDVMTPLIDLRQARYWSPARSTPATDLEGMLGGSPWLLLIWFEALCGWLIGLILLAVVTGLGDRDRRL